MQLNWLNKPADCFPLMTVCVIFQDIFSQHWFECLYPLLTLIFSGWKVTFAFVSVALILLNYSFWRNPELQMFFGYCTQFSCLLSLLCFFFSKVLYLLGRSHEKRYFFAMLYFSFNSAPKWEPKMKCFMAYSYLKVCDKI